NQEDESVLRARIQEVMARIDDISDGLCPSKGQATMKDRGVPVTSSEGSDGEVCTSGDFAGTRGKPTGPETDGSIKGLHGALKLSMELVSAGEKHASDNSVAMAEMSTWLTDLQRKQIASFVYEGDSINKVTMTDTILSEGCNIGEWVREFRCVTKGR
ncbi:unnamed protein product, partial [Choristocarpus tenellus]